jgi:hypothetical protein
MLVFLLSIAVSKNRIANAIALTDLILSEMLGLLLSINPIYRSAITLDLKTRDQRIRIDAIFIDRLEVV